MQGESKKFTGGFLKFSEHLGMKFLTHPVNTVYSVLRGVNNSGCFTDLSELSEKTSAVVVVLFWYNHEGMMLFVLIVNAYAIRYEMTDL